MTEFEPIQNRVPQHNLEAEENILGAILLDPDAITRVIPILEVDSFYIKQHRIIYKVVLDLHSQGKITDITSVSTALANTEELEKIGGAARLAELVDKIMSTASIKEIAELVAEKHIRRQITLLSEQLAKLAYDKTCSTDSVLAEAEKQILALGSKTNDDSPQWSGDILAKVFNQITISSGEESGPGILTGFQDIDRLTQGLQRTDLIILAARPAMGKTAVALNIARNVARKNQTVVVFSLEMSQEQLMGRLIAIETGIETRRQREGKLRREEWSLLAQGASELAKIPLAINDKTSTGVHEMKTQCRKIASDSGKELGLIIIDYLQLMEGKGSDNRVQEVSRITRHLKGLAKELNAPVMALSQLSRGVEQRTNKRPMLSDLRESGSIEQDADVVCMLYRDEYYNPETADRGITEFIIAKSRHGPVGTVQLLFEPQFTRFRNSVSL